MNKYYRRSSPSGARPFEWKRLSVIADSLYLEALLHVQITLKFVSVIASIFDPRHLLSKLNHRILDSARKRKAVV